MKSLLNIVTICALALHMGVAAGDPNERQALTVYGDAIVIGNTMGRECNTSGSVSAPTPVVGSIDCTTGAPSGTLADDTAPDIFWRADDPVPGQARAGWDIGAEKMRTTVQLNLPAKVEVRYARLYWAARTPDLDSMAGLTVRVERPGVFNHVITADAADVGQRHASPGYFYQASANVTALVAQRGSGAFRVSEFKTRAINDNIDIDEGFVGFWMVVVYESPAQPPVLPQRHIAIFDGIDQVDDSLASECDRDDPGTRGVCISVTGFRIPPGDPQAAVNAKMAIVSYEGDDTILGDAIQFRPLRSSATAYTTLSNALNPADNFFNGSSSFFGASVSAMCDPAKVSALPAAVQDLAVSHCNAGALPQNTGEPFSGSGLDIDVFNLSGLGLQEADTQARFRATSAGDFFVLSGFITSFASLAPNFLSSTKKVTTAPKQPFEVIPGDTVRYTIMVRNTGNDASVRTVVSDVLDARLKLVPGSVRVASTADGLLTAAAQTETAGDDLTDFDMTSNTLTVRVGVGADATVGGSMTTGALWFLRFDTVIVGGATGAVANIARISAGGQSGAPDRIYRTAGTDVPLIPQTPVVVLVAACTTDEQCTKAPNTHCKIGSAGPPVQPNVCVACLGDADCSGTTPVCDAARNICVSCSSDDQCARKDASQPLCTPSGACGCSDCAPVGGGDCKLSSICRDVEDSGDNTSGGSIEGGGLFRCSTSGAGGGLETFALISLVLALRRRRLH